MPDEGSNHAGQRFVLVPGGGVEPPRPEGRRILSPLRLPVPPSRLGSLTTEQNLSLIYKLSLCNTVAGHGWWLGSNHFERGWPEAAPQMLNINSGF
jgi:hypothetical protein